MIDDEEGWGKLQLIVKRGNGPAIIIGAPSRRSTRRLRSRLALPDACALCPPLRAPRPIGAVVRRWGAEYGVCAEHVEWLASHP